MRTSPPDLPKSAPPSSKSGPRCAVLSRLPSRPSSTECRRTSSMAAPLHPSRDGRTITLSTSSRLRSSKPSRRIWKAARRARQSSASTSTSPCPSPSWCDSRSGTPGPAVAPLPSRRSRRNRRPLLHLLQSATLESEHLDRFSTSIQRIAIPAGGPRPGVPSTPAPGRMCRPHRRSYGRPRPIGKDRLGHPGRRRALPVSDARLPNRLCDLA